MSYTRSGRQYKGSFEMSEETAQTGTAAEAGQTGTVDVQQVLQMLMEDRRQREEEIAAERRQREEVTERRLQEMQQHVESLLRVVEKTTSGSGSGAGGSHESEAKVSKLTEADDFILDYLRATDGGLLSAEGAMGVQVGTPADR